MVASVASRNGSYDNDSGCGRWEGRDGEARDSQAHVYCLTKGPTEPPTNVFLQNQGSAGIAWLTTWRPPGVWLTTWRPSGAWLTTWRPSGTQVGRAKFTDCQQLKNDGIVPTLMHSVIVTH